MEKKDINTIIGEHQKINRMNKVTRDFVSSQFGKKPLLISRDDNSHVLVLIEGSPLDEKEVVECRMLCKSRGGMLALPIVGAISFDTLNNDTLKIEEVVVPDAVRNNGIGRLLIQFAENIALERDCRSVVIDCPLNKTRLNSVKSEAELSEEERIALLGSTDGYFDKNLYICATLGYGTDWERNGCDEYSTPVRKDNLSKLDLRYGRVKSETKISPESDDYKITQLHEFFNAGADSSVHFPDQRPISEYEPISAEPTKKDLLTYERILNKDKTKIHPYFRHL